MKNILLLLVSLMITPIFAQDKIAKITSERWDESENKWIFNSEDSWDYNHNGQEILYTHEDSFLGDFFEFDYTEQRSFYNAQGNLIQQKVRNTGMGWSEQLTDYQYDEQQTLTEVFVTHTHSDAIVPQYYKGVYEYNEAENRYTTYSYRAVSGSDNWQLTYRLDSLFNDNGCLIKNMNIHYDTNGAEVAKNWFIHTYTPDCQLLSSEYWIKNFQQNSEIPVNRSSYEYFNEGKLVRNSYSLFNSVVNQWELKNVYENEVDDEGRAIRFLYQTYYSNSIDSLLRLTTYTPKGERATYKEYRTGNFTVGGPLALVLVDSFVYHYNEKEWLVKREEFIKNQNYPWRTVTIDYEYYCQGQLKQSIYKEGLHSNRLSYEYHSATGCPLDENESPKINIFPNPSNGSFTINSNLIATPNARLSITSILGQTVYTEKLNRLTKEYSVDFSSLPNGRYVLTLSNDEAIRSEIIVINN